MRIEEKILKSQLLNARYGAVEVPFPLDNDVDLCSTHVKAKYAKKKWHYLKCSNILGFQADATEDMVFTISGLNSWISESHTLSNAP